MILLSLHCLPRRLIFHLIIIVYPSIPGIFSSRTDETISYKIGSAEATIINKFSPQQNRVSILKGRKIIPCVNNAGIAICIIMVFGGTGQQVLRKKSAQMKE